MGDVITLEGEHFLAGDAQAAVRFGSLLVTVAPLSDTRIDVAVPEGAAKGSVTVTTTAQVDGRTLEQTSNPAAILVMWKRADLAPLLPANTTVYRLLPGQADDVGFTALLTIVSGFRYSVKHYNLDAQGNLTQVSSLLFTPDRGTWYDLARAAVDPISGSAYCMFTRQPGTGGPDSSDYEIQDMRTGAVFWAARFDAVYPPPPSLGNDSEDYIPMAFGFDASGSLLVAGARAALYHVDAAGHYVIDRPVLVNFWRYSARALPMAAPVKMRPETAVSPSSFETAAFSTARESFDLAVAPDGTALCRFRDYPGTASPWRSRLWIIPSQDSSWIPYETPLPFSETYEEHTQTPTYGTMATDCLGRFFIMENRWETLYYYDTGPIWMAQVDRTTGALAASPVAQAPRYGSSGCPAGEYFPAGITTDGYGDVHELAHDYASFHGVVHRFTPCELDDPGFYDDFDCCATRSALRAAGKATAQEAVGVHPVVCDMPGILKLKLTAEPGDPISGDPGNPNTFAWIIPDADSKADASVFFGQAPKLEAIWQDTATSPETAETVKWEVVPGSETAPNADPKGLYSDRPELLFNGGGSPYSSTQLQFQSVHTGTFILKATTTNPQHKGLEGQPSHITLAISITAPNGLLSGPGPVNTTYDGMIVSYANKYGIPPQYIKRQVWQESDQNYNPDTYRYELLSWDIGTLRGVGADFGGVSQWSSDQWAKQGMDHYEFPAGGAFSSADMTRRDKFHFIASFDPSIQPPTLPYACGQYDATSDYSEKLVDIFQAEDGWRPDSYPHQLYNSPRRDSVKGPCGGIRMNWSLWAGLTMAYDADQYYCGTSSLPGQACGRRQQSFTAWFCNHPDTPAQSAVAASYGLLQLMYYKAVIDLHWNKQFGPETRDPALLLDPAVSLDLGSYADCVFVQDNVASRICNPPDLLSYQQAMADGIRFYNKNWNGGTYGLGIVKGAYGFRPQ